MDWRLVLENPQFRWPADVVAEATRLGAAERRQQIGECAMKHPLDAVEALVAPDASYHSHSVHGGEIRIPMASHGEAIRVMREARMAIMALRGECRAPARAASSVDWSKIARASADDTGLMNMGPVPPEQQPAESPIWRHSLHVPGARPVVIVTGSSESPFGDEGVVHSARILPRYSTVSAAISAEEPLRKFLKAARADEATARADVAERILAVLADIQAMIDGAAAVTGGAA